MGKKTSKRLVIDTSVARGAGGEDAVHPDSKACRDFLLKVLSISHRIVVNTEMKKEWDKHQSKFFTKWRGQMVAKRKFIFVDEELAEFTEIKERIEKFAETYDSREAMEKDCFLLELALAHDKIIVSKDEKVRSLFNQISIEVAEIKEINWINPIVPAETPLEWLDNANLEYQRSLGYRPSEESK